MQTKKIRFLIITLAGNDLGYGHLSRCLSLAEYADNSAISISFLLFGDNHALSRVEQAGYKCSLEPISSLDLKNGFAGRVPKDIEIYDAILIDLSHQNILIDIQCIDRLFQEIRKRARIVILIDALGVQALATKYPGLPIDVLVVPYVFPTPPVNGLWHTLKGPRYAVLSKAYANYKQRIVRHDADRILVSCGGGDPTMITPIILHSIERISKILNVRVIIGPLFNQSIKEALRNAISNSKHIVELIYAPTTLAEHMRWCDIAIATTGLIKYELAATATPSILFSIDKVHDLINRPFEKMGTAIDLGISHEPQLVADQITKLLENYELRVSMGIAGRRLVDGKGAERLINEILIRCYE